MRGMKREIRTKIKIKLVLVIIVALIISAVTILIIPDTVAKWRGFIFFAEFITISGIGVFIVAKQSDNNKRY